MIEKAITGVIAPRSYFFRFKCDEMNVIATVARYQEVGISFVILNGVLVGRSISFRQSCDHTICTNGEITFIIVVVVLTSFMWITYHIAGTLNRCSGCSYSFYYVLVIQYVMQNYMSAEGKRIISAQMVSVATINFNMFGVLYPSVSLIISYVHRHNIGSSKYSLLGNLS